MSRLPLALCWVQGLARSPAEYTHVIEFTNEYLREMVHTYECDYRLAPDPPLSFKDFVVARVTDELVEFRDGE